MIYRITITETLSRTIEVEAPNEQMALVEACRQYKQEDVVLDADDFVCVEFEPENPETPEHK